MRDIRCKWNLDTNANLKSCRLLWCWLGFDSACFGWQVWGCWFVSIVSGLVVPTGEATIISTRHLHKRNTQAWVEHVSWRAANPGAGQLTPT